MIHSQGHQISSVRLSRRVSIPLLLLLGLSATGLLFTPLWVGLGMLALLMVVGVALGSSRVTITAGDEGLTARCMGIFHVDFAWSEILSVEAGPETGVLEGAGYRLLPGGRVGLLIGGPTVEVRDARKTYLLSGEDPQAVAEEIRRHLATANSKH